MKKPFLFRQSKTSCANVPRRQKVFVGANTKLTLVADFHCPRSAART